MAKVWDALKRAGRWLVESKAWLFIAGLAAAVAGLLLFSSRNRDTGALDRERDLSRTREAIDKEAAIELTKVNYRERKQLSVVNDTEVDAVERITTNAAVEREKVEEKIHAKYRDLGDDDDAARKHIRELLRKS
jgi:uncharacterized protein (DUF58 family)